MKSMTVMITSFDIVKWFSITFLSVNGSFLGYVKYDILGAIIYFIIGFLLGYIIGFLYYIFTCYPIKKKYSNMSSSELISRLNEDRWVEVPLILEELNKRKYDLNSVIHNIEMILLSQKDTDKEYINKSVYVFYGYNIKENLNKKK